MDTSKHKVIVQKWEVSERGSGSSYDSYTVHLSERDRAEFVVYHNEALPPVAPESYIYASGAPYMGEIDAEQYNKLTASPRGVRFHGPAPLIAGPMIFVGR